MQKYTYISIDPNPFQVQKKGSTIHLLASAPQQINIFHTKWTFHLAIKNKKPLPKKREVERGVYKTSSMSTKAGAMLACSGIKF